MRITSKGQVTIPIEVRRKLGLLPNTEVEFEVRGNSARLVKTKPTKPRGRGASAVARLRGTAKAKLSTDAILALTRSR
jgi:antitoxin PrlF